MASNKKIFDVTQIDLDGFARLITLLILSVYTVCRVNIVLHCIWSLHYYLHQLSVVIAFLSCN